MPPPATLDETLFGEFMARAAQAGSTVAIQTLAAKLSTDQSRPEVWQRLAARMMQSGYFSIAVNFLDIAIRRFSSVDELRYLRGNALRLSARSAEAEQDFRHILSTVPNHRNAALSLAAMLREDGRLSAATLVIVNAWNVDRGDSSEAIEELVFLRECGAYRQACELAVAEHERHPDNADIAALAGEFALTTGEFALARKCLLSALDRDRRKSACWLRLAFCQRFSHHDDLDLRRIEDAWQSRVLDPQSHICAGFALGKALDDLADYGRAVMVLREANAIAAAQTSWRSEHWQTFVKCQVAEPRLPQVDTARDFSPLFVIGLPRTGTTLISSLLGRDRRVRERGELNWIGGMYALLAKQRRLHDPSALSRVATLVLAQMRQDDEPALWYLDKNPLNFRYLNLIEALFPQAKIIHCRRQHGDTALSLWMQYFAHEDLGFSYDFSMIDNFFEGYERLTAHWRKTLRLQICDVDYESLVEDTATTLHRVKEFLELPFSSDATQPLSESVITTASVWQARQSVYTTSIGRSRRYASYLPELARFQ
jgi:tetratricopeptide (TPR) repeat protein